MPYRGFIEEFLADWEQLEPRLTNADMVTRFVTRLYEFVLAHRDLIFALAAANRFGTWRSTRRARSPRAFGS